MGWIEINIPFSERTTGAPAPECPNLDGRLMERFGLTLKDACQLVGKAPPEEKASAVKRRSEILAWYNQQPEIVTWREERDKWREEHPTFCSLGLARPGVLIELEDGSIFLIGDIDRNGHVSANESPLAFDGHALVKRYKVPRS